MENAKTLSDAVEKLTLSGNELIVGLDGRNIKIPLSAIQEFLGVQVPSGIGGVVPNEDFVPGQGSTGNPAVYFAGPGTYPGFGGEALTNVLNVISWNGTAAVVKGLPIEVPPAENKIPDFVSGETYTTGRQVNYTGQIWSVKTGVASTTQEPGTGTDWVPKIDKVTSAQLGIEVLAAGVNIWSFIAPPNFSDTSIWGVGFIRNDGSINATSTSYRRSINFLPVYPGSYDTNIYLIGTDTRIVIYDKNYSIISVINSPKGNSLGTLVYEVVIPENAAFVKLSLVYESTTVPTRFFSPKQDIRIPSPIVFATPELVAETKDEAVTEATDKTRDILANLGITPIPAGTNFLADLNDTTIDDATEWQQGFIRANGTIEPDPTYFFTVKYRRIYPGKYRLRAGLTGNAAAVIYDKDLNPIMSVTSPPGPTYEKDFEAPAESHFIRVSNRQSMMLISDLGATALEDIWLPLEGGGSGGNVSIALKDLFKKASPVRTTAPVATFMSDDGSRSDLDWLVPLFESKGALYTMGIITARMLAGTSVYMHKNEVIDLYKRGFDIASHSHTHVTTFPEFPEAQFEEEMYKSRLILNSMGIECPMYVSPFGQQTVSMARAIKKYYDTDFISRAGVSVNTPPINSYNLSRVSFDASVNGVSTLQTCKEALDLAFANGGWVIFTVHPHYPEYLPAGNPDGWEQRRQELSDLIDYINSKPVPILTAKAAYQFYKNPVQIGAERTESVYYALGMNGSEKGTYLQ